MKYKNFDPMVVVVICRIFEDSNVVCKLLENSSLSFGKQHTDYKTKYMLGLFEFLKIHYSKYELVKFIQEINTNFTLFEDIYNMYRHESYIISPYFSKVKISLINIHDELMASGHRLHISSKYTFEYKNIYKDACVITDTLEYRLPYTGEELSLWSIKLNNCLFSYAKNINNKFTTVYGVFKENELVYALEIYNGNIVQALKHSNLPINFQDNTRIHQWFNKYLSEQITN